MTSPNSNSPSETAMAAARELLQMDGVLTTYRCAGKGNGAEEQIAAIIDRHFSGSLARVEGELCDAKRIADNAVKRAQIAEQDDRLEAWMKVGGRLIALSSDFPEAAAKSTGMEVAQAVVDSLRADLAAKGEALTHYARADFLTTEQQSTAENALNKCNTSASNTSMSGSPAAMNGSGSKTKESAIMDAAFEVAVFSKTHAYPKEMTPEFFDFATKLDALATAINARYPGFNRNIQQSALAARTSGKDDKGEK